MAATPRDKEHIIVNRQPESEDFASRGRGKLRAKEHSSRLLHGKRLVREYDEAISQQRDHADDGYLVSFASYPDFDLTLESLDYKSGDKAKLLSTYRTFDSTDESKVTTHATVFIPPKENSYIGNKLYKYVSTAEDEGKPSNAGLVDNIDTIQAASAKNLWTDPIQEFPEDPDEKFWWEAWLAGSSQTIIKVFEEFVDEKKLRTSGRYLGFADRTVILVEATVSQIDSEKKLLGMLAELRKPASTASFLLDEEPATQREWIQDILNRQRIPADIEGAPAVCLLDTGVQHEHPLLSESLSPDDVLSAKPDPHNLNWDPTPPNHAQGANVHGTEMAGLALYGNLDTAVASEDPINLSHRLESVRILPRTGSNEPDHYADITSSATSTAESNNSRPRTYMMAVTSKGEENDTIDVGHPTSWSSAIDALSFGQSIKYCDNDENFAVLSGDKTDLHPRLFVLSAGNINLHQDSYDVKNPQNENDVEAIENPAQAWNALTVGAYSDKDEIPDDIGYKGYSPLSHRGDLLATSRTSVMFNRKKWPIKPDVVAAGGNYAVTPAGEVDTVPELELLTTRFWSPGQGLFTVTRDTSAATAKVAAIAADIQAHYPQLRPETVRALIIHSAEWTPEMRKQIDHNPEIALRRYGMGIPNLDRAISSATDDATLISESRIRPFWIDPETKNPRAREMNMHQLPWPTEVLENLGNTQLRLRVTLSFFIEPNPSNRGWNGRYSYPSYGLRFAIQRRNETIAQLRRRINQRSPAVDSSVGRDNLHYVLPDVQEHEAGSTHSSIWEGPAVDLARTNAVAIYPTNGWWKESLLNRNDSYIHYSLIVSLKELPSDIESTVPVDLWTPISLANQISTAIPIQTQ